MNIDGVLLIQGVEELLLVLKGKMAILTSFFRVKINEQINWVLMVALHF